MERPAAIEWIRKLRRIAADQVGTPEGKLAARRADDYQRKHKISEAEVVAAQSEQAKRESSSSAGGFTGGSTTEEGMQFLQNFVHQTRATLCAEGRKRGRWADTPHGQRILRHRANAAAKGDRG